MMRTSRNVEEELWNERLARLFESFYVTSAPVTGVFYDLRVQCTLKSTRMSLEGPAFNDGRLQRDLSWLVMKARAQRAQPPRVSRLTYERQLTRSLLPRSQSRPAPVTAPATLTS